jgi:hypothetical protein
MGWNHSFPLPCILALLLNLSSPAAAAGLLEDGDDFSNNLVSDLAPYVAASISYNERLTNLSKDS